MLNFVLVEVHIVVANQISSSHGLHENGVVSRTRWNLQRHVLEREHLLFLEFCHRLMLAIEVASFVRRIQEEHDQGSMSVLTDWLQKRRKAAQSTCHTEIAAIAYVGDLLILAIAMVSLMLECFHSKDVARKETLTSMREKVPCSTWLDSVFASTLSR